MKFLLKLLFGKPSGAGNPKRRKKNLLTALPGLLVSLPLLMLKQRWNKDLWNPKF